MRANRAAVVNRLVAPFLNAGKIGLVVRSQAELARDDFLGEIAFADKQRYDEYARRKHAAQHGADGRLQFPEAFNHLREDAAPAQFIRVLIRRRGRVRIERRSVSHQHQRGVRQID